MVAERYHREAYGIVLNPETRRERGVEGDEELNSSACIPCEIGKIALPPGLDGFHLPFQGCLDAGIHR